jgi:hypothetical protein
MDMSTVLIAAMVLMMVLMVGGMVAGAAWSIIHRRGRHQRDD